MKYIERITVDSKICHGKPCIRSMRFPVVVLLDLLGSEMTYEEILEDYPQLEKEDIFACINYALLYMNKSIVKEIA